MEILYTTMKSGLFHVYYRGTFDELDLKEHVFTCLKTIKYEMVENTETKTEGQFLAKLKINE